MTIGKVAMEWWIERLLTSPFHYKLAWVVVEYWYVQHPCRCQMTGLQRQLLDCRWLMG
jgi:hypothetical protein